MGRKPKSFKSAEFIDDEDNDGSVVNITSSSSDSDTSNSSSSGSSTAFASDASILDARDSVNRELDPMDPILIPPPVAKPARPLRKTESGYNAFMESNSLFPAYDLQTTFTGT